MNWRVTLITAAISLLCAMIFSISPVLENSRADVMPLLKGSASFDGGARNSRRRDYMVIGQVALSMVLLVSAGLLIRALLHAKDMDPGFTTTKRLYLRLFTPDRDFTPPQATTLYSRLLKEARAIPGVRDATLSFAVFGFMDGDCAAATKGTPPRRLSLNVVDSNYFAFMQTPLLKGRTFLPADRPEAPRVIVINQTMAQRWWPGQDAIGKTAWLGCHIESQTPAEVVGVVRDSKYGSLDEPPRPFYFVNWRQVWWNGFFALMLHTEQNAQDIAQPLLRLARTGGPDLRIYELRTFDDLVSVSLFLIKWQATLLVTFSALAIALATLGLYSVVAYAAQQRTQEIGIRMALGAQPLEIRWMVLRHGLTLAVVGVLIGMVLSAGVAQLLQRFLFGIRPLDAMIFSASPLVWILISTVASCVPASRATKVDPVIALRFE